MKHKPSVTILFLLLAYFYQSNVFAAEPKQQRIISLSPATTEILYRLGLDDEIVAVTTFCNYPPQAQKKERVGSFSQPNFEKIIMLKPDLILATGLEQASSVEKLRQLGLSIYVSDPANIEELFASLREIGSLTHREKEAMLLVNQMKAAVEAIKSRVAVVSRGEKPKVFIEIWHDPLMTAGKGSYVDELIRIAGGENIAFDAPRPYSYFSVEQVIECDPDYIILGYMSQLTPLSVYGERLGWKEITAVKNKRIYNDINPDLFFRPGPRLVEGLQAIHEKLYPHD